MSRTRSEQQSASYEQVTEGDALTQEEGINEGKDVDVYSVFLGQILLSLVLSCTASIRLD